MTALKPNLTSEEAHRLCQRLHKKFKDLDFDRALEQRDTVEIDRMEVMEVTAALSKLEERLQWCV